MLRLLATLRRVYWRLLRPFTLGARVLITRGNSVLLARHSYQPWWYLPGGGVKKGESFVRAARREVHEETGLVLEELRLFHLYLSQAEGKNDHIALFVAAVDGQDGDSRSPEIAERAFHPLTALPANTSPATRRRIAEYLGNPVADTW